jgi:hypothetical protein
MSCSNLEEGKGYAVRSTECIPGKHRSDANVEEHDVNKVMPLEKKKK